MNRAAAAIFLAMLCSACRHPLEFGPEGRIADAEVLYKHVRERQSQVVTLEGDSKLHVDSPQGSGTLSMFVAIQRPGLIHLETSDFFNRPVAMLVSDGKRFGLYQAQGNTYYQGPASPENVSRFLPVVLPSEELVAVMLGQAPLLPPERMTLELNEKERVYVLTLFRGAARQTLRVDPKYLRILKSEVRGVPGYDLAFDDFKQRGNLLFPGKVSLDAEAAQTKLELRYQQVTLNGRPDLTLYELGAPEGAKVVEVDERGQELPAGVPGTPPPPTPGS
jgi:outer membrane lipoprotein-sorting protein